MHEKNLEGNLLLILTALIWGVSFVAQSVGMNFVGPFTFNGVRCILGGLVLVIYLKLKEGRRKERGPARVSWKSPELIRGGMLCGAALFVASSFQQFGLMQTTVGKSGFLTALYIIIVPILMLFLKKSVPLIFWLSVIVAMMGMYLLCIKSDFTMSRGDILTLCGSLFFSVHILLIDHFSPKTDGVKMSCIQFFVCGVLSLLFMAILEDPKLSAILSAWLPILYSGALSCGVAYTLQIVAQKYTNPVVASLLLSLESVFAAVAGWFILRQALTARELAGCALVFAAIILKQVRTGEEPSEEANEG